MNILITGGAGFIGFALAKSLVADGHKVDVVDRNAVSIPGVTSYQSELNQFIASRTVITSLVTFNKMYDDPLTAYDVIFHLAGSTSARLAQNTPELTISNNVNPLLHILHYCTVNPSTRLIVASSGSVKFGGNKTNPYALSKSIAEDIVNLYRNSYSLNATSARLFNVYGPGERSRGKNTTFIKHCIDAFETNHPIEIHGDGTQCRDFTHIDDAVSGLRSMINIKNLKPLYEIGYGQSVSLNDIAEKFNLILDVTIQHQDDKSGGAKDAVSNVKLYPPGWQPKHSLDDYLSNLFKRYSRIIIHDK